MHSHFPESIFMNTLSWMTLVTKPISEIGINLLAFYHECGSMIGYDTHCLLLRFRGVCEEHLDTFSNDLLNS